MRLRDAEAAKAGLNRGVVKGTRGDSDVAIADKGCGTVNQGPRGILERCERGRLGWWGSGPCATARKCWQEEELWLGLRKLRGEPECRPQHGSCRRVAGFPHKTPEGESGSRA
jgi:hypothetical protein